MGISFGVRTVIAARCMSLDFLMVDATSAGLPIIFWCASEDHVEKLQGVKVERAGEVSVAGGVVSLLLRNADLLKEMQDIQTRFLRTMKFLQCMISFFARNLVFLKEGEVMGMSLLQIALSTIKELTSILLRRSRPSKEAKPCLKIVVHM